MSMKISLSKNWVIIVYNKSNVYYIKLGDCKVRNINQIGVTDTISPIEYIVCYKDNDKIFLLENNWVDFNQSPLKTTDHQPSQ